MLGGEVGLREAEMVIAAMNSESDGFLCLEDLVKTMEGVPAAKSDREDNNAVIEGQNMKNDGIVTNNDTNVEGFCVRNLGYMERESEREGISKHLNALRQWCKPMIPDSIIFVGLWRLCYNVMHPLQGSSMASNLSRLPFQIRNVKLDFPHCDGHNVLDWIFKAEQFFVYYANDEADRLSIASAITLDFGPTAYECPRASLLKLNQTGTVGEYYKAFIGLANRVSGINNEALLDCFLSGLQTEIRRNVMTLSPSSLVKASCPDGMFGACTSSVVNVTLGGSTAPSCCPVLHGLSAVQAAI
ncbi:hypothetical protein V8G54_006252 [Vigna mungo]|uniref:Retrotransposon gag domain-containing protein n=1 Tax=Vigna mungo TaxID=3915 RepID=A0AAQ3NZL7_VIGMU